MRAKVAPIDEENDTSKIALYGSNIIPDVIPNINATGREKDVSNIYIKKK